MSKEFLIIRLSSFGDIVLAFPLIAKLKRKYPDSSISFVVRKEYSELVKINPLIDECIVYEEINSLRDFDHIIDLQNNFRSTKLRKLFSGEWSVYRKDHLKKFLLVRFKYNLYKEIIPVYKKYISAAGNLVEGDEDFEATDLLRDDSYKIGGGYSVIAPSSKHFTKTYPKEKFIEFINDRSEERFLLVGSNTKVDKEICFAIDASCSNTVNLCGELSYSQLSNILFNGKEIITNDSGVMHLAESLGKPVIAIFGSTVRQFGFFPQLKDSTVLEVKDLECRPCSHIGKDHCPKKHFYCMNKINLVKESL